MYTRPTHKKPIQSGSLVSGWMVLTLFGLCGAVLVVSDSHLRNESAHAVEGEGPSLSRNDGIRGIRYAEQVIRTQRLVTESPRDALRQAFRSFYPSPAQPSPANGSVVSSGSAVSGGSAVSSADSGSNPLNSQGTIGGIVVGEGTITTHTVLTQGIEGDTKSWPVRIFVDAARTVNTDPRIRCDLELAGALNEAQDTAPKGLRAKPVKSPRATLLYSDSELWSADSRNRRLVRIPAKLATQRWLELGFSYGDIVASSSLVDSSAVEVMGRDKVGQTPVWVLEAYPRDVASESWAKQVFKLREDGVLVERAYYGRDFKLQRKLTVDAFSTYDGEVYPAKVSVEEYQPNAAVPEKISVVARTEMVLAFGSNGQPVSATDIFSVSKMQ